MGSSVVNGFASSSTWPSSSSCCGEIGRVKNSVHEFKVALEAHTRAEQPRNELVVFTITGPGIAIARCEL